MHRRRFIILIILLGLGIVSGGCAVRMPDLLSSRSTTVASPSEATAIETLEEATEAVQGQGTTSRSQIIQDETPPPFDTSDWRTDFSTRSVEWTEILSGGPPKDGIPAIDDPQFESIEDASTWLSDRDPVIFFANNGVERAYPLSILIWHEIVNDVVGGKPVAVTFCPLCNASIVFDREFEGEMLDFGTTGRLRNSDLIMYDRQSETWWQQFTGEAIIGQWTGAQLRFLPSQVISFADFAAEHSTGQVLARPNTNGRMLRTYGRNPYVGYDSDERPFLFRGRVDDRLSAVERVVGLTTSTAVKAYPWAVITSAQVIEDTFDEVPIVLFHKPGRASALDSAEIAEGRDIGTVGVYERQLNGQTLSFRPLGDGLFLDSETGTTWNILGKAVDGPHVGEQLIQIIHFDHFWFAWQAFFPSTEIYQDNEGGG